MQMALLRRIPGMTYSVSQLEKSSLKQRTRVHRRQAEIMVESNNKTPPRLFVRGFAEDNPHNSVFIADGPI
jgi:hypothetical protein